MKKAKDFALKILAFWIFEAEDAAFFAFLATAKFYGKTLKVGATA
jgi:hypothetical protein